MKAAFLDKPGMITVREIPTPEYADDQVLIRIREIGLCGSDLHYFREGRIGDHVVRQPHILGHECYGEVAEVGRQVKELRPGDRVSVEPGVPCLSCEHCREGRYNLCAGIRFLGVPNHPGAFREYIAYDPRFVHRLPDSVSDTAGALAEPLAVGYNAVQKCRVAPGSAVLVLGAGAIGLSCLKMARIAGAATVIVADPLEHRLEAAGRIGADCGINPRREDLIGRVREVTGGRMCDCSIEASGSAAAVRQAILALKKGGRAALVGMGLGEVEVPHLDILRREAVIAGVYRYRNQYRPVIELLRTHPLRVEDWVSHRYPLERLQEAMEAAGDPQVRKLKIMIQAGGEDGAGGRKKAGA